LSCFRFRNCCRIDVDTFELLEKSSKEYQAKLRKLGRNRHFCEKKPFQVNGPIHPKSYFQLPRNERIIALKEVAANIEGKAYNSSLGCAWKVGTGAARRVRDGTGSSGVLVGCLSVVDDAGSVASSLSSTDIAIPGDIGRISSNSNQVSPANCTANVDNRCDHDRQKRLKFKSKQSIELD